MPISIAIRFLSGRAHLHPWQTHHSEGRVEWPPSPWRLLRAVVAVAGRGLTSLPPWNETPPPRPEPIVQLPGVTSLKKRGVPEAARNKLMHSKAKQTLTLSEPLADGEASAWKRANPSREFAAALDELRLIVASTAPEAMADVSSDEITLSRLAVLLEPLTPSPEIWLPKTSGGHTRQFFPLATGEQRTGSAVFDTFAVVDKHQPIYFHWPTLNLLRQDSNDRREANLKLILSRLTYFGRAESWCEAAYATNLPESMVPGKTHWPCLCIEDAQKGDGRKPEGREHQDYTLVRTLAALPGTPCGGSDSLRDEALRLFTEIRLPPSEEKKLINDPAILNGVDLDWWHPRLVQRAEARSVSNPTQVARLVASGYWSDAEIETCAVTATNPKGQRTIRELLQKLMVRVREWEQWQDLLTTEPSSTLLLRCLLRESGEDMKGGLERPIGTRWVHYAVPRAVFEMPPPRARRVRRRTEMVHVVRYVLNTATTHRPVLPSLTDTLLVADKFRSAALAVHDAIHGSGIKPHPRHLCGHESNGDPCLGHEHAFFWPTDEDNDGFIDRVTVYCREKGGQGFEWHEIDALRRLVRIRQRGGRPDLLVTPVFVGKEDDFGPWPRSPGKEPQVFVSATPYFCPVHLSHGRSLNASSRSRGGRLRPVTREVVKGLLQQGIIETESDVRVVDELVFDYAPAELVRTREAMDIGLLTKPIPPRQFFPVIDPPTDFPSLPRLDGVADIRFRGALIKDADQPGYPFGTSVGLFVDDGNRFIRALAFCRRRRNAEVKGDGRMLRIVFREPRKRRPFSIGAQCHLGLGLFVPEQR